MRIDGNELLKKVLENKERYGGFEESIKGTIGIEHPRNRKQVEMQIRKILRFYMKLKKMDDESAARYVVEKGLKIKIDMYPRFEEIKEKDNEQI
ncbi:MAG: hypothetical protein QXT63_08725 [Thermoplasmata archaeon]